MGKFAELGHKRLIGQEAVGERVVGLWCRRRMTTSGLWHGRRWAGFIRKQHPEKSSMSRRRTMMVSASWHEDHGLSTIVRERIRINRAIRKKVFQPLHPDTHSWLSFFYFVPCPSFQCAFCEQSEIEPFFADEAWSGRNRLIAHLPSHASHDFLVTRPVFTFSTCAVA